MRLLLGVVVTAGLAASVVAGTARTVAALGALATRTLTALEVLTVTLGGTLGASRGLGLVETIERNLAAIVDLDNDDLDLIAHVEDVLDLLHAAVFQLGDVDHAAADSRRRRRAEWRPRDRCTPRPAREP